MFCPECGSEMRISNEPIKEEFRNEELLVCEVDHYVCDGCGEVLLTADAADEWSDKVDEAYRKKLSLLSPDEIKEIRNSFKLTQSEFENLLGVGKGSVHRWESGKLIQSKVADNLIRIFKEYPSIAESYADRNEIRIVRRGAFRTELSATFNPGAEVTFDSIKRKLAV